MILLLLTLLDGSAVNLKVPESTTFTLQCRYGTLKIPAKDLQDCSLGVHYDDKLAFDNWYNQLADKDHKVRDQAMKNLKAEKRGAAKYIKLGLKSSDPEVVRRCELLMRDYPEHTFPQIEDDLRVDGFGNVSGVIQNAFIEGKSDSLGALKIPLSQIYYITVKTGAKKALKPDGEWREMGFARGKLHISVTGSVDFWPQTPGQWVGTPDGVVNANTIVEGYPSGAVVGRINGKTFLVGSNFFAENVEAGILYLRVNKTQWNSIPTGEFEVVVE